jgi:hypothetical protein
MQGASGTEMGRVRLPGASGSGLATAWGAASGGAMGSALQKRSGAGSDEVSASAVGWPWESESGWGTDLEVPGMAVGLGRELPARELPATASESVTQPGIRPASVARVRASPSAKGSPRVPGAPACVHGL